MSEQENRFFTVGGSGGDDDYLAVALLLTKEGKREPVVGVRLKGRPEVAGFVQFVADQFGRKQGCQVAMVELPMIYWIADGGLEEDVLISQAISRWVDDEVDPSECFYDCLEEKGFESFYSDYKDALSRPMAIAKRRIGGGKKKGKGFA